jgi:hypothetical protein
LFKQTEHVVDLSDTQLSLLIQHKSRFDSLHVAGEFTVVCWTTVPRDTLLTQSTGLVKKNMAKTSEASEELAAVMLSKAPESIKTESIALSKRRSDAFKKATAVYEGATGGEDEALAEDSD